MSTKTTAFNLIKNAMQKAGILVKSEDPDADEANDGLDMLNDLFASWSNESMLCYARFWETFNLQSGISEYTIGDGAQFNTVRPTRLLQGCYIRQVQTDWPLTIISDEVYNQFIYDKQNSPGIPEVINFDNNYPVAKIRLWPVPDQNYSMFLLSEKPLLSISNLNQEIELPPGWNRMIINNLALEMCADYGVEPPETTVVIARQSKGSIQRAIIASRTMDGLPIVNNRQFNIYASR